MPFDGGQHLSARNCGIVTQVPPTMDWPTSRPRPATWKSGATSSETLSGALLSSAPRVIEAAQKLACDSITPLERPVVPPV